ncbi:MAG: hypothetical protein D6760_02675, partial [Deltaproteobacteria bacterium]
MSRLRRDNFIRWLAAASLLACVQVVIEVALVAWRYAGVVLPPRAFFDTQRYDAFAKIYARVEPILGLPPFLDRFVDKGGLAKLALAPELLAMALPVALVLALLPGLVSALRTRSNSTARILTWLAVAEIGLHFFTWAENVHLPVEPTAAEIARNFARNFLYDGTAFAVFTTVVATAVGRFLAGERIGRALLATVACAALALAAGMSAPTPAAVDLGEPALGPSRPIARGY